MAAFKASTKNLAALLLAAALLAWGLFAGSAQAEKAVRLAPPQFDPPAAAGPLQTAVFAGGCFWGVQAVFQHTQGVVSAVSGYAGGDKQSASYEAIGSGRTGHAEAVQVTYDPARVSYGKLLQVYFSVVHDPTQLNRQGPDTGPQYRSALFYSNAEQQDTAIRYIAQLDAARSFPAPIVTQLTPLPAFYPAEAYHQDYATLHPESSYIARFDLPKIANLKSFLPEVWREQPVLVGDKGKG